MNGYDMLKAMNGLDEAFVKDARQISRPSEKWFDKRALKSAAIILLCLGLLIPSGVYAYQKFFNRETVTYYLGDADAAAAHPHAVQDIVLENADLRMSIDTILSDGHSVLVIKTVTYKTDLLQMELTTIPTLIQYARGSEKEDPFLFGEELPQYTHAESTSSYEDTTGASDGKVLSLLDLHKRKISADEPLLISYYYDSTMAGIERSGDTAEMVQLLKQKTTAIPAAEGRYLLKFTEDSGNLLQGFEFEADVSPNVDVIRLKSAEGKVLYLSDFEIFAEDGSLPKDETSPSHEKPFYRNFRFITKSGQRITLKPATVSSITLNDCFYFGELVDLENIAGVEIYGKDYLADTK